uniref:Transcriptional regulator ATRX n=1 Tax=Rhipicephalus zambeziensis TaxID=60191 RepID=A0A224ZAG9_9ACAR
MPQAGARISQAQQIYTHAYNLCITRGATPAAANSYALNQQRLAFQQLLQQQMGNCTAPQSVVISEVEDDAQAAGSSSSSGTRQPSSSSVVITEVID